MESKPRSMELIEFRDELLPSGRKLLHCLFKEKFGTSRYAWIPPWKGDFGVERLFFKALEIEEWNDYEGAWSKELRKASKEIPSLEEIRLPVKIRLGEMADAVMYADGVQQRVYRTAIEVLSDEARVWKEEKGDESLICISDIKILWESLKSFLLKQAMKARIKGVSKGVESVTDWIENRPGYGDWEDVGIRFSVWLEAGLEKAEYRVIGKEIASDIRSFIRKRLSDYKALKNGFEEL